MKAWGVFNSLLLLILVPLPGYCQGMAEFGGTRSLPSGLPAGLGAGLAAVYGKNAKMSQKSYQTIINAQQAASAQTKAIDQYMKYGCQLEAKKNWANAELAFQYVLQIISRRDGPGSRKSVPTLEHLVSVTKAQNKLGDAIRYQQTVVAFKKMDSKSPVAFINAETLLSNLHVQNSDFKSAASVLRESVSYCNSHPSVPAAAKKSTLSTYAQMLHKLHKDEEAKSVEDEITHAENTGLEKTGEVSKTNSGKSIEDSSVKVSTDKDKNAENKNASPDQAKNANNVNASPEQGKNVNASPDQAKNANNVNASKDQDKNANNASASPDQGKNANSTNPSPDQGKNASSTNLNPDQGKNASSTNLNPDQGKNANSTNPSPEQGKNASSTNLSPDQGKNANSTNPSPEQGKNASSTNLSPDQGKNANSTNPSPDQSKEAHSTSASPDQSKNANTVNISPDKGNDANAAKPVQVKDLDGAKGSAGSTPSAESVPVPK